MCQVHQVLCHRLTSVALCNGLRKLAWQRRTQVWCLVDSCCYLHTAFISPVLPNLAHSAHIFNFLLIVVGLPRDFLFQETHQLRKRPASVCGLCSISCTVALGLSLPFSFSLPLSLSLFLFLLSFPLSHTRSYLEQKALSNPSSVCVCALY